MVTVVDKIDTKLRVNTKNYFVFDLDDTLVDGRQFCGETIATTISTFDKSVDFQKIIELHEEIRGLAVPELYSHILKKIGKDNLLEKIPEMLKMDSKLQSDEIGRLKMFEGVVDILQFLKNRDKKIYMCSNRYKSLLTLALEYNGIVQYFDKIISCIDEGYKKPDPTTLLDLIKADEVGKEEFIYFGDSEVDSQFAKNAGIEHIIFDQYLNDKNLFKKLVNMFLDEKINGGK